MSEAYQSTARSRIILVIIIIIIIIIFIIIIIIIVIDVIIIIVVIVVVVVVFQEIVEVASFQTKALEAQQVSRDKEVQSLRQQLLDIQTQSDEKAIIGKSLCTL